MTKKVPPFGPKVRARAVRMVSDHVEEHGSQWAAIQSISSKIGCSGEMLRNWGRQTERDEGLRPGPTSEERERTSFSMRWRRSFISDGPSPAVGSSVIRTEDRNMSAFDRPSAWPRPVSSPPSAASETVTTTLSPRPVSSRPRSSTDAGHGAPSRPSSSPPSNGSTGSPTAACLSPSETSRPQRPKQHHYTTLEAMPIAA